MKLVKRIPDIEDLPLELMCIFVHLHLISEGPLDEDPHKGETVFPPGKIMEVQGMVRIPSVLSRRDPGDTRGKGWGGVIAHTNGTIFLIKLFQFT